MDLQLHPALGHFDYRADAQRRLNQRAAEQRDAAQENRRAALVAAIMAGLSDAASACPDVFPPGSDLAAAAAAAADYLLSSR
jgi:hypothetical protein